jgi:hypothetical protein
MVLRPPLPEAGGEVYTGAAATTGAIGLTADGGLSGDAGEEASTGAPHLLQNLVPEFRLAPQELQNAIYHLAPKEFCSVGEYIADRR